MSISARLSGVRTRFSNRFTLPERFKGTVVEKWAKYWRGLISDYKEVVVDVAKDARAKPRKAVIIGSVGYGLYASVLRNPDEEVFMQTLRNWNNRMGLVPKALQNPESAAYLQQLEQAVNQNTLRMLSLGVCTLLWVDLYDKDDCTYPAICEYTRVSYWNIFERVIDVGFWNHFWRLEWKMRNFDVNYL